MRFFFVFTPTSLTSCPFPLSVESKRINICNSLILWTLPIKPPSKVQKSTIFGYYIYIFRGIFSFSRFSKSPNLTT
nr:MAG TPA_asm: hypothetical protein [Caudoviricetes sp.]